MTRLFTILLTFCLIIPTLANQQERPRRLIPAPIQTQNAGYITYQAPELLTYDELLELGSKDEISAPLKDKLTKLRTTPFISNEAYYQGIRPLRPELPQLGPSLRMINWNIERGLRLTDIKAAFTGKDEFTNFIDKNKVRIGSNQYLDIIEEAKLLQTADLIVLQELDWGMKRTDYREVVRELATALKMNWAYGVEFIEIDPINLGIEQFEEAAPEDRDEMRAQIAVDKGRFRGLHGTAVLSRYPIVSATLQPYEQQCYDWYESEKERVSSIEKTNRAVSEKVLLEKISREIRRGGRTKLLVTLDVADLPEKRLTVAASHIESRCKPECRRYQLRELLADLRGIKNPVIFAGDLNTSLHDSTPTSFKRELTKRVGSGEFWAKKGLKYATGVGLIFDVLTGGINFIKNQNDPTAKHVPLIAPNPEAEFFEVLEDFHFDDNYCFDFRGDKLRSYEKQTGTLSNSNQRASKGYAVTFEVERSIGPVGKLKLDWIFVKPYINDSRPKNGSYRFAPHFARTLEEVNYAVEDRMSDHNPMCVDLPFNEPKF